jgi:tagatose 6-phosphate kinase
MILVVGLSPAWQRTLVFDEIIRGKVNRAKHVSEVASGKGVNVARVAAIFGAEVRLLTVAGGVRGRLLKAQLQQQRFGTRIMSVEAETRICQTLLGSGTATELVEEAGALHPGEVQEVLRAFALEVRKAKLVVLTGTVPKGCGDGFYAGLVDESRRRGVRVLIDAQKAQLLHALDRRPFLVKINRDELMAVTHVRGAQWAVITDGAKAVHVTDGTSKRPLIVQPPRVKAKNPIGSGDAMLAGIAVGLTQGKTVLEAVQLGVACGAANAMTIEPGFVRLADVKRLCSTPKKRIRIV